MPGGSAPKPRQRPPAGPTQGHLPDGPIPNTLPGLLIDGAALELRFKVQPEGVRRGGEPIADPGASFSVASNGARYLRRYRANESQPGPSAPGASEKETAQRGHNADWFANIMPTGGEARRIEVNIRRLPALLGTSR